MEIVDEELRRKAFGQQFNDHPSFSLFFGYRTSSLRTAFFDTCTMPEKHLHLQTPNF